jgi:hypothetical protein
MGYRNYGPANGFIVSPDGTGDFKTIAAALSAASSGDTIFLKPSTYTENPTLKAGVNITAFDCDALTPNVTLIGEMSFSSAGTVSINGLFLQTNSSFILSVTGSAASIVNLTNCYLNCTNNTGISFSSSSASSAISLFDCQGNLGTTGIAFFSCSTPGIITLERGDYTNTGASSTANTVASSGFLLMSYLHNFMSPISLSGTSAANINYCRINSGPVNTTAFTTTSTSSTPSVFFYSSVDSGSASAISIGAGSTVNTDFIRINSNNTSTITGSGTFGYGNIIYSGTTSNDAVTTQTPIFGTGWQLLQTQTASSSATLNFINIGGYKNYAFVFNGLAPATSTATLELTYSVNNGSSYIVTGYNAGLNYTPYNSATITNKNASTFIPITGPVLAAGSGGRVVGNMIFNVTLGYWTGSIAYFDTTANTTVFGSFGGNGGSTSINAFNFAFSTGNITSGSIDMYGIAG